jgi:hypothetical protein
MANRCEMEMRGLTDLELDAVSGGSASLAQLLGSPAPLTGAPLTSLIRSIISHSFNSLTQGATQIVYIIIIGNNDTVIVNQTAGNTGSQTT